MGRLGWLGVVLVALLVCAACAPQPRLQTAWPRADAERTVTEPSYAGSWPLTGKPALDASSAGMPPVAVTVADAGGAPLPGLEAADLVFEQAASPARILALFQSSLPSAVSPARDPLSADRALAALYGARLTGGAGTVDVSQVALAGGSTLESAPPVLQFASQPPAPPAGTKVAAFVIPMGGKEVEWRYDGGAAAWRRYVAAKPQQGTRGAPVRATNVAVVWSPTADASATPAGSGRASVFIEGRKFSGSWEASGGPLRFRDETGALLPLVVGNTWVEVLPTAATVTLR